MRRRKSNHTTPSHPHPKRRPPGPVPPGPPRYVSLAFTGSHTTYLEVDVLRPHLLFAPFVIPNVYCFPCRSRSESRSVIPPCGSQRVRKRRWHREREGPGRFLRATRARSYLQRVSEFYVLIVSYSVIGRIKNSQP